MTPDERIDFDEAVAVILDGNTRNGVLQITVQQAEAIALRCLERKRAGYPVEQQSLPLKETA